MLIPDFSKNTDKETLMYFTCGGDEKTLMDALENDYPGFTKMKPEIVDGSKYICVYIDYTDF